MVSKKKYVHEDYYVGLKKHYFYAVLDAIIKIGGLKNRKIKILDFGCGNGKLKQILGNKVTGYDVVPELTGIKDWRKTKFDVVVVNEVFYLFSKEQIRELVSELKKINPRAELIVGISKQNILNKTIAFFVKKDAFDGTIISPKEEIETLKEQLEVLGKKTVWLMCDVYHMKFKQQPLHPLAQAKCPVCGSKKLKPKFFLSNYNIFVCGDCKAEITDPNFYCTPEGSHIYSEAYFREKYPKRYAFLASRIDSQNDSFAKEYFLLRKKISSFKEHGKPLDVGCSNGLFLHMAQKQGWKVKGIETSKYASDFARKNFGLPVKNSLIEKARLGEKFDVITMLEVIEHLKNHFGAIVKCGSLLEKDGLLLLKTIHTESLVSMLSKLIYWVSLRKIKKPLERCCQSQHTVHFSIDSLKQMFERAGFEIIKTEKTEIQLDKLEKGIFLRAIIAIIYFFQGLLGMPFEFYAFAKKKVIS